MKRFDKDTWERKEIFDFFSSLSDPFYMVSFRIDVSELYDYAKAHDLSFYMAMIWACDEAINDIQAFRLCIKEDGVCEYERRDPSFTYLKEGRQAFQIITMEHIDDIDNFCKKAIEKAEMQEGFIDLSSETDDLIYYSCLPWIDLTALTNEKDHSSSLKDDSIPRIAWGKYKEENGRKILTVSMEVNHRFIDGIHIAMFAGRLEEIIKGLSYEC